jgi:hypothetical protein
MRVLHFGPTIAIFIAEVSARANRSLMVFTVTVLVSTQQIAVVAMENTVFETWIPMKVCRRKMNGTEI